MKDGVLSTETYAAHRIEAEALDDVELRSKIAQLERAVVEVRENQSDETKVAFVYKLAVFREVLEDRIKRANAFLEVSSAPACIVGPKNQQYCDAL